MNARKTRKEEELQELESEYLRLCASGLGPDEALDVMAQYLHASTLARLREYLFN